MDLKTERSNTINHADTLVNRAKAAGRDLTPTEVASVEAAITRIEELDKQIKGRALADSVMKLGTSDWPNPETGAGAGLFTAEAKTGIAAAFKTRTSFRAELPAKAALTTGTMLPPSGTGVQGGLHPNSQFPIAELFRQVPAEGPVQRYYRMGAGTAAVVAEGALKPDAGITIAPVDLALSKIAATAQASDEMSEDAPYLMDYLGSELSAAVLAAENAKILDTFNTTSGVLTGTGTTATVIDLIADAISSAEAISGITPTAVIANPTVVATIRKAKNVGGGDYLIDPLNAGPTTIHGVRVIPTPATAAGTAWVVDASGVLIYRRGPLTVEVGTNADDWVKNLRTVRAELRMATAVTRPSALTRLTLT